MTEIPPPQRILVIMLRRIGDVLLTTPAIRALKRLYPKSRIDFLTEPPCHEVLAGNPDIDELLVYGKGFGGLGLGAIIQQIRWTFRLRQRDYDWVIDYMGNPRSAVLTYLSGAKVKAGPAHVAHRWAYSHRMRQSVRTCYAGLEKIRMLRSLELKPDESDFLPLLNIPRASRAWADSWAASFSGPSEYPLIGLIPSSRKATRRWPAKSYSELGRLLVKRIHARIVVFWGTGEEALAREVAHGIGAAAQPSPPTRTLQDLAALIRCCRMVITNCNGPKHIAVACGVPTLTIHGSSDPDSWNPPDHSRFPFIRKSDLFCIGCRLNACPYHLECMRDLSAEAVARKALELLEIRRWDPSAEALSKTQR